MPSKARYLSFQAKVIIPVVILLMLFLAIIVWLVNGRLTEQFEDEARQNLRTAQAVFRNSFEIRTRNLILRYQSMANEPRFKAVAQLADSKTMSVQLNELLQEIGPQAAVMQFTLQQGDVLAIALRDRNLDAAQFRSRSSSVGAEALSGRAAADTIVIGEKILTAVAVPVSVNDILVGVLTIGDAIGPAALQELKSLTRTEIAFIAGKHITVSTFRDAAVNQELISIYDHQTADRGRKMEAVAAGNEHFLCIAGHFPASTSEIGYLLLSSYESALQRKKETQGALTLISLAGILFSSLLMWVLIRKITRPLRKLRDSAEAVGRGDFTRRVEVESHDECGELATVFNQMTENLTASRAEVQQAMQTLRDTQAQLIQTEKLSAMGKFIAGIAHELNNPLTGVIGFSQMLQESGIDDNQQSVLNRITGSAERCRRIVQSLLSFSRRQRPERKWTDVHQLIEAAIDEMNYDSSSVAVQPVLNFAPMMPLVLIDPHQMKQVFLNILTNAKQATENREGNPEIRITTEFVNGILRIRLQDNGAGITEQDLPHIFNPFFTTKPVGSGTGLGLSIAYGIVREHDGTILVESRPGEGAMFTIDLPVETREADAVPREQQQTTQHL